MAGVFLDPKFFYPTNSVYRFSSFSESPMLGWSESDGIISRGSIEGFSGAAITSEIKPGAKVLLTFQAVVGNVFLYVPISVAGDPSSNPIPYEPQIAQSLKVGTGMSVVVEMPVTGVLWVDCENDSCSLSVTASEGHFFTESPFTTDFTSQYSNLLIQQYYTKLKARSEIELWASEFESINSVLKEFETRFDIDNATGDRLDKIGTWVGISRTVVGGVAREFFGFDGTPNARTFDEGSFFTFLDSGFANSQLTDDQMRFYIRCKILNNKCTMTATSDSGTSIQDVIQFAFRQQGYAVDNYDLTYTINLEASYPESDVQLLIAQDLIPRPESISYEIVRI